MLIDRHYRPHINDYDRISSTNLRNFNLKNLKKIDPRMARYYADAKMMGGSFKSFVSKIGNFGKKILKTMPRISKMLHTFTGKALTWLNSDTGKAIVDKLAKAAEAGLKLPGLSQIINKLPSVAKEGFDRLTEIVTNIKEQNPGVTLDQAKNLVQDIYNTSTNIYQDYKDSQKKAEEKTAEIADKVSNMIKEDGKQEISAGLLKSAKYLPLFELCQPVYTKKSKSGGMISLNVPYYKKPSDLIKRFVPNPALALKEYPVCAGKIAGRLYLGGSKNSGKDLKGLPNPNAFKQTKVPEVVTIKTGITEESSKGLCAKKSGKSLSLLDKLRSNKL